MTAEFAQGCYALAYLVKVPPAAHKQKVGAVSVFAMLYMNDMSCFFQRGISVYTVNFHRLQFLALRVAAYAVQQDPQALASRVHHARHPAIYRAT